MQRYFIKDHLIQHESYLVDEEISHHILKVMRGNIGDRLLFVDVTEQTFLCELTENHNTKARITPIQLLEHHVEMTHHVSIACGLSKNDKIEWIVQKATECGMSEFIPLTLSRDVMKWPEMKISKKLERLSKIAQEAAEQSHREKIPIIQHPLNLGTFIEKTQHFDIKLVAYEETAKQGEHYHLKKVLSSIRDGQSILMVFGSEGGFSENEVQQLKQAGFEVCSLGPRILRAETAPIYFLSALSYELEL